MQDSTRLLARDDVHKALGQWSRSGAGTYLGDLLAVRESMQKEHVTASQAAGQLITSAIDTLERQEPEQARLLRLRYLDGVSMLQVANRLNRSEPACYRIQRQAIDRLADILEEQEHRLRNKQAHALTERLGPAPYARLFGLEHIISDLLTILRTPSEPWLLLLEGIGGVGKTSTADALMRAALAQGVFLAAGWVTAQQQIFRLSGRIETSPAPTLTTEDLLEDLAEQMLGDIELPVPFSLETCLPLLRQRLQDMPHLIVVDNLETVADLEALLPTLQLLARPSKIVLTARRSLLAEANLFHCQIPELSQTDAFQLLRYEARLRNVPQLEEADEEILGQIYDTVGGNPLALKLVVGQVLIHDLPAILNAIKQGTGRRADHLFTYIFHQAWQSLDETAQRTLLAMPLAPPEGLDLELLSHTTGLDESDLLDALNRLVRLNLVERKGDLLVSRYNIHSLTRTFLQEQVSKWR